MLKNAFYFMLKAVFALEIFIFLSRLFLLYAEKQLDKKAKVNFKTSQTVHQLISIRILSDISRSKGNQSMKFGQLIEHNMRKILFEKSCTSCKGETSPRPFRKQSELSISLGQQVSSSEMLESSFLLHIQVDVYQKILKLKYWPLVFTLNKASLKRKRGLELVSLPCFLHGFLRKNFLM